MLNRSLNYDWQRLKDKLKNVNCIYIDKISSKTPIKISLGTHLEPDGMLMFPLHVIYMPCHSLHGIYGIQNHIIALSVLVKVVFYFLRQREKNRVPLLLSELSQSNATLCFYLCIAITQRQRSCLCYWCMLLSIWLTQDDEQSQAFGVSLAASTLEAASVSREAERESASHWQEIFQTAFNGFPTTQNISTHLQNPDGITLGIALQLESRKAPGI